MDNDKDNASMVCINVNMANKVNNTDIRNNMANMPIQLLLYPPLGRLIVGTYPFHQ